MRMMRKKVWLLETRAVPEIWGSKRWHKDAKWGRERMLTINLRFKYFFPLSGRASRTCYILCDGDNFFFTGGQSIGHISEESADILCAVFPLNGTLPHDLDLSPHIAL